MGFWGKLLRVGFKNDFGGGCSRLWLRSPYIRIVSYWISTRRDISFTDSQFKNVLEETKKVFNNILKLEVQIQKIEEKLANLDDNLEEYTTLFEKYSRFKVTHESRDGYSLDYNCKRVLSGLGFSEKDYKRFVRSLSGGWRMKIELAKILLQNPFLLLLDEPT